MVWSREEAGWFKVQEGAEFLLLTKERECGTGILLRVSGVWERHRNQKEAQLQGRYSYLHGWQTSAREGGKAR